MVIGDAPRVTPDDTKSTLAATVIGAASLTTELLPFLTRRADSLNKIFTAALDTKLTFTREGEP